MGSDAELSIVGSDSIDVKNAKDSEKQDEEEDVEAKVASSGIIYWLLLFLSCTVMLVSGMGAVLLTKLYFKRGGSRRWLSAWLQTSGWPVGALTLLVMHWWKKKAWKPLSLKHCVIYVGFGILHAADCLLYAWGISYLPASTFNLLGSSQLIFNCIFALCLVKRKISAFAWNAVVLITSSAVLLALHSETDSRTGTKSQYYLGFGMTISAAALYGLILPLTEIIIKNMLEGDEFAVGQVQTYTNIVGTVVLTIGMIVAKDFSAIPSESHSFTTGQVSYYMILFWTAVLWQVLALAVTALMLLTSSLLVGIITTAATPLISIFAVVFLHETFGGMKVMATVLSLWGFISYGYGGYVLQHQHAK